jgi:hypothetical protein
VNISRGGKNLPVCPVNHVKITVAVGMQDNFSRLTVNRQIDDDVFVDAVVVKQIVRAELIKPDGFARVRISRKNSRRPFVVARTQFGIPDARIRRAVENQIRFRVVRDEAPDRAAADFPLVGIP